MRSKIYGSIWKWAWSIPFLAAPGSAYQVERVVSGLQRPVYLTAPDTDASRAFIVEQHTGRVRIVRLDGFTLAPDPFLTVPGISTGSEQGLLGLAFHPDYATNGLFYVYITDPDTKVIRYHVSANPDLADPSSGVAILGFAQPDANHNGGWIGFGPDGYLYIATGDGGGGNDSGTGHTDASGNAQDLTSNLLGKVLRIDVDRDDFPADATRNYGIPANNPFVGTSGDDEIWAYGLRNPWRASFDRQSGDLFIADVGEDNCEEIDVLPATAPGGSNFGWRLREGLIATPTGGVGGPPPSGAIDPIVNYSHGTANPCSGPGQPFLGNAITGGYVYRGPAPELQGRYFFADFGQAHIWSLLWDGSSPSTFDGFNYTDLTDHDADPRFQPGVGTIDTIASFGEDAVGNLYIIDLMGEVFTVPEPNSTLGLVLGFVSVLLAPRLQKLTPPSHREHGPSCFAARFNASSAPRLRMRGA